MKTPPPLPQPAPAPAQQVIIHPGYTFGKFCLHFCIAAIAIPAMLLGGCVTTCTVLSADYSTAPNQSDDK